MDINDKAAEERLDLARSQPGCQGSADGAEACAIGRSVRDSTNPCPPYRSDRRRGDLTGTADWGSRRQEGVPMPGRGKSILRSYTPEERAALEQVAEALGLGAEEGFAQLGIRPSTST